MIDYLRGRLAKFFIGDELSKNFNNPQSTPSTIPLPSVVRPKRGLECRSRRLHQEQVGDVSDSGDMWGQAGDKDLVWFGLFSNKCYH